MRISAIVSSLVLLASVPAVAGTVVAPDGCKFVTISRPGINQANPEINITFRGVGSDVNAIRACNPDSLTTAGGSNVIGVAKSPNAGARVSVRTKDGKGIIGLPTIFADGTVHQNACTIDPKAEGGFVAVYYFREWDNGLPEEIALEDASATQKADFLRSECLRLMPPDVKAQLQTKE